MRFLVFKWKFIKFNAYQVDIFPCLFGCKTQFQSIMLLSNTWAAYSTVSIFNKPCWYNRDHSFGFLWFADIKLAVALVRLVGFVFKCSTHVLNTVSSSLWLIKRYFIFFSKMNSLQVAETGSLQGARSVCSAFKVLSCEIRDHLCSESRNSSCVVSGLCPECPSKDCRGTSF